MTSEQIISASVVAGTSILLSVLERKFPYDQGQKLFRKGFWTDFLWFSILFNYLLGLVIFQWVIPGIDSATNISRLHLVSSWPIWVQCVFFLVTHEIYIYWFHRLQHKNKWLWRLHEAHHSPREIDWAAGSRTHAIETLINQTIEYAPIILLGAAPEVALFKGIIDATWGMFIHSNLNIRLGWFQYVINGPEMHRWHHAQEKHDINFSTKLAIWDWLFGTAYFPKTRPKSYGIDVEFPTNIISQQLFAFRPMKAPPAESDSDVTVQPSLAPAQQE